ncbi:MAG: hypothetical protein V7L25_28230 [Nostoc sp.]|uniref:hypothetical protein n=1 Tax=Nostoc sp. TaxID=1180 RepID=UPI002FF35975
MKHLKAIAPRKLLVNSFLLCINEAIATTYLLTSDYSIAIMTSDALTTAITCFPS